MFYQGVVSNIKGYLSEVPFSVWTDLEVSAIVAALINLALVIAVVVCFFFLIFGGIKWITAGGDKEAMLSAQKTITAAIVGIVIVFSVWAILNVVRYFFGIEPTSTTFFIPSPRQA